MRGNGKRRRVLAVGKLDGNTLEAAILDKLGRLGAVVVCRDDGECFAVRDGKRTPDKPPYCPYTGTPCDERGLGKGAAV